MKKIVQFALIGLLLLTSCKPSNPLSYIDWSGRWKGVEGTHLDIVWSGHLYIISITDLDGTKSYEGHASSKGIIFERNDTKETIHAGNGQDTGMKWLADKKNCLVIHEGEGYCRD